MSPPPPPHSTNYHWKIIKMLDKIGCHILLIILLFSINKPDGINLEEYFKNLPPDSLANYKSLANKYKKKYINKKQADTIKNDPTCKTFDITLLFLCIKLAWCKDVATYEDPAWSTCGSELENCIFMIKDMRNDAMHNIRSWTRVEFLTKVHEMRMLFKQTLREAQKRYSAKFTATKLDTEIRNTDDVLDSICNEDLGEEELRVLHTSTLWHDLEPMCKQELRENLDCMRIMNPVSFISGVHLNLDVGLIFAELEIDHLQRHHTSHTDPDQQRWVSKIVPHEEFFAQVKNTLGGGYKGIKMVLLEGLAGAGKTTMMRLILQQWCDDVYTINDLDTYQVVFHVMGRDHSIHSYEELIQSSLPHTSEVYRNLLKDHLKHCSILVLMDGFDEGVQDMTTLLQDLLNKGNENMTILCASRPERSEHIHGQVSSCGKNVHVVHTKIVGVPKDKRIEFVKKSHEQLKQKTGSGIDTKIVVEQLRELVMNEHFRLPINIILAVYVCDQESGLLTTNTTQTELYFHTFTLTKKKLIQVRLRRNTYPQVLAMTEKTINDSVNKWISHMNMEQFLALSASKLVLDDEAVDRLSAESNKLNLPATEMMSSFLNYKSITVDKSQYSASHKGLQEYCAARHVMKTLKSTDGPHSLIEILKENHDDLQVYQNMLSHMLGLMHLPDPLLPDNTDKIGEVITLLAQSGIKWREQWLDLIEETKASTNALKSIAHFFQPGYDHTTAITVTNGRTQTYRKLLNLLTSSWIDVRATAQLEEIGKTLGHHYIVVHDENTEILGHLPRNTRVEAKIEREIIFLDPILQHLGNYKYTRLQLYHQYYHPCTTDPVTHNSLENSSSWYQGLETFTGQLSTSDGERLQHSSTLNDLSLSVASDDQAEALNSLLATLTHLNQLSVHVNSAVSPSVLAPLPALSDDSYAKLYLSDVSDDKVDWAVSVAAALQPSTRYLDISFPRGTLDQGGWTNIIHGLHHRSVRVGRLYAPSDNIRYEKWAQLNDLANTTLNAGLSRVDYSEWEATTRGRPRVQEVNDFKLDLLGYLPRDTRVAADIKREIMCHDPVLQHLGNYKYSKLQLYHQYYHPCTTDPATHNSLENSSSWYQDLETFAGQLSTSVGERLQHSDTLKDLSLSVASDNQAEALNCLIPTLIYLKTLSVHITPAVSPSVLIPLPALSSGRIPELYLSDVSDDKVDWAVSVAAALQPSTQYWSIHFPRGTLDQGGWTNLIHGLHHRSVKVWLRAPSDNINEEEQTQLNNFANTKLRTELSRCKFTEWKAATPWEPIVPYTYWKAATPVEPRVQEINDFKLDLLGDLPRDTRVEAKIEREITCHDPILQHLGNCKYTKLQLYHQYYHPCTTDPATHNSLENSSSWNQGLETFTGQLSTSVGERLQHSDTLKDLSLSVASDNQAEVLNCLIPTLTHLKELNVHMTPAVSPSVLIPLPALPRGCISSLYLSDVSDDTVDWAVSVAAALQPATQYWSINFPRGTLDQGGWTNIIHGLHHWSVRVGWLYAPSDSITHREWTKLYHLTRTKLRAWLHREDYTEWESATPGRKGAQQTPTDSDELETIPSEVRSPIRSLKTFFRPRRKKIVSEASVPVSLAEISEPKAITRKIKKLVS